MVFSQLFLSFFLFKYPLIFYFKKYIFIPLLFCAFTNLYIFFAVKKLYNDQKKFFSIISFFQLIFFFALDFFLILYIFLFAKTKYCKKFVLIFSFYILHKKKDFKLNILGFRV